MASSGIRLGAWDYIHWKHIQPIKREGITLAAKIVVYAGDDEMYFSFITPEAYYQLENWMKYRKDSREKVDGNSWLMRQIMEYQRRSISSRNDKGCFKAQIFWDQKIN